MDPPDQLGCLRRPARERLHGAVPQARQLDANAAGLTELGEKVVPLSQATDGDRLPLERDAARSVVGPDAPSWRKPKRLLDRLEPDCIGVEGCIEAELEAARLTGGVGDDEFQGVAGLDGLIVGPLEYLPHRAEQPLSAK